MLNVKNGANSTTLRLYSEDSIVKFLCLTVVLTFTRRLQQHLAFFVTDRFIDPIYHCESKAILIRDFAERKPAAEAPLSPILQLASLLGAFKIE